MTPISNLFIEVINAAESPAADDVTAAPEADTGGPDGTESDSDNQIISKSLAAITSIFEHFTQPQAPEAAHPTPPIRHQSSKSKKDLPPQPNAAALAAAAAAAAAVATRKKEQPTTISRLVIGGTVIQRPNVILYWCY